MTELDRGGFFSGLRMVLAGAGIVLAALQLSACTSIEEGVPVSTAKPSGLSSGQASDTGTFPNLNIPPKAANQQFTPDQKTAKFSELKSAQGSQAAAGTGSVPNDQPRLKKIAATHAAETLAEIEGN
ncbi:MULTISPECIES: hypothetical protein [unclassified Mesorhizobium]|uniref:hypothetical protein n=1 Tax=unclassified Mesorhizobium TaxID=325217 RepID=UPI0030147D71